MGAKGPKEMDVSHHHAAARLVKSCWIYIAENKGNTYIFCPENKKKYMKTNV